MALDLTVTITAFSTLVVLALLLDIFLTPNWAESSESATIVLALFAICLTVSLFTAGYIIYRLGCRLWAGPQDLSNDSHIQVEYIDLYPPSYEIAILGVDLDLPTYESIAGMERKQSIQDVDLHLPSYESISELQQVEDRCILHM